MSLGETFSAMETHMIDGAENNMRSFHSSRHFEAAKYWSQTAHSYAPDVLLMSRDSLRRAVARRTASCCCDTARASVPVMRAKWDASEGKARAGGAGRRHQGQRGRHGRRSATRRNRCCDEYHQQPEIDALYRRIRDLA